MVPESCQPSRNTNSSHKIETFATLHCTQVSSQPARQDQLCCSLSQSKLQYLALGVELTNIHRVLVFQQTHLLKSQIIFNIDKRKHAADEFEKDFTNIQLFELAASSSFDSFRIFFEELDVAVNMPKTQLYLNHPIYIRFTVPFWIS